MNLRRIGAIVIVASLLFIGVTQAAPPTGAIFTTTPDGGIVNENVKYDLKREVYLDGGPPPNAPKTSAGLDDGFYVFQVTDPSGKYLLSMDPAMCRVFEVVDGIIVRLVPPTELGYDDGYVLGKGRNAEVIPCHIDDDPTPPDAAGPDDYGPSGRHDTNVDVDHGDEGAIVVQLMPFGTTPNPGGVYKAWIVPLAFYQSHNPGGLGDIPLPVKGKKSQECPDFCAAADLGFGPPRSEVKTDNFKVIEYFPPEVTVRKFHDLNCDGVWDLAGEPEIGVDQLVKDDGSIDPDGGGWPYNWTAPLDGGSFTAVTPFYTPHTHLAGIPGLYSAWEWMLPGWRQCAAYRDGVALGVVNPVGVTVVGDSHETHEIIFGDCQLARLYGKKVIDLNGDGEILGDICDPADLVNYPGCAGVTVYLDGMDNLGNEVHLDTLTGADGSYEFNDLYPGEYTITIDEPAGFECSYPAYGDCRYEVELFCTDDEGSYDFGDFSRAEVHGRKVIDLRADGPDDDDVCPLDPDPWGNNAGCQGVTVHLDGIRNIDETEVHSTTVTADDGTFSFEDLYPGDYTVTVDEPPGFFCSFPEECEYELTLDSDEVVRDLLFGDYSKAEISGRKLIDIYADGPSDDDACPLVPDPWGNNAGCQGILIDLDGHTFAGVHVQLQTYTDDDGYFEFLDLEPGNYTIGLEDAPGFFCSYPDTAPEHCHYALSVVSDEVADWLVFGDYSKADIHAFKCFDVDESGACEEGEAPVAGIKFCLWQDGVELDCQTTGTDGLVHWEDLMPGTYTVEETLPPGWFCTGDASQRATLMSDEVWQPEFGNVTNCVGLTPGYWGNWDNHYTADEFTQLLVGTVAEGETLETATFWLSSVGCDGGDAFHCMRRFLLANQLTLNLTQLNGLPNPDRASMFRVCMVPGMAENLGHWLDLALEIMANPGGFTRDEMLAVKTVLDRFANLELRYYYP